MPDEFGGIEVQDTDEFGGVALAPAPTAKPKRTREQVIASIPGGAQPEPTPFWTRVGAALEKPVAPFTPHEMSRTIGYAASKAGNVVMNPVWQALGYAPNEYEPGKPIVPIPAAHGTNLPPIATVPLRMLEGLTTPEGATMLAMSGGSSAPAQLARTGFLTQIAEAAPESFGRLVNPEATSRERQESAIELALGALGFMGLGRSLGPRPTPSGLPSDAASYTLEGFEKRPAYETPIIGERPRTFNLRNIQYVEPETLGVQPVSVPTKPPIVPSGGKISFRGEGVPSARQAREMLPATAGEQERLMQDQFIPAGKLPEERTAAVRESVRKLPQPEAERLPGQAMEEVVTQPEAVGGLYGKEFDRFMDWAKTSKDRLSLEGALSSWQTAPFDFRREQAVRTLNQRLIEIQRETGQERQTIIPEPPPKTPATGTVKEALTEIAQDRTSPLNKIASELKSLGDQLGLNVPVYSRKVSPGILGQYHPPGTGFAPEHITIADYLSGPEAHSVIVHEALHAFVWLKTDPAIRATYKQGPRHEAALENYLRTGTDVGMKQLIETYFEAKRTLSHKGLGSYGMTDFAEFLSEAWSNPKFQAFLQQQKAIHGGSLWQKMIAAIKKMLGLTAEDTLLGDVIRVSSTVVKAERPKITEPTLGEPEAIYAQNVRRGQEEVPSEGVLGGRGPEPRGKDIQRLREQAQQAEPSPLRGEGEAPAQVESIGRGISKAIEQNKQAGAAINPIAAAYSIGKGVAKTAKEVVNLYSEPLQERLGRIGGPVAKRVSQEAGQIISQAKKYYGELTPEIDPAKVAAGKLARGGTTWIRGVDQITDKAAVSRAVGAIEGTKPVPPEATSMVTQLKKANLAIGQLAQKAAPGFTPSGKMQRMLTSYGVDIIRRGRGPAWDALSEGIAKANDLPVQDVQVFLRRWKDNLDAPGVDVAALDKINQDFVRKFPNAVTHIKPGVAWHEVLVSDPFSYIEQAAQRTAHAAAFREVYKPQSGLLAATRKAVLKEIESGQYGGEFDKLMRALQGHPVDTFTSWWNAPDTPIGGAMRMAGQVVAAPMRSLVLTGNFLTNLGETVSGGPMIFLGPSNVLPAMKRMITDRTFYPQMEMAGAVNRAMQNYALDPTSPVRSTFRALSNTTRRVFAEQLMNELQEAQGAGSAKVLADRIRSQSLGPTEQQNAIAVFRAMGFTPQQAAEGVLRANADVLGQFERKASSFLTAGHQLMGERSTLGASRAFNELFWFHSYPQMALNQFRSVAGNLAEDIGTKNWSQARANAKLMGRLLGGRTFQGALTVGIMSLAYEGIHGAKERKQEAQDEFAKFLRDSFIAAMGGPLYLVKKGVEAGGDSRALQQTVGSVIAPVSIGGEIMDASLGNGRYEGQTATERAGAFLESKTPGFRAIRTGMALFGLSSEDKELETAKRAFYRWRREKMGWRQEIGTAGEDEDKRFRALMRKAVDALENGKDWRAVLTESGDIGRAGKSLGARALLKTPEGKDLSEEQLDALRKHIGTGLVDKLQLRDAMVRELGRVLREGQAPEKMAQPTGTRAIDFESATKRSNRVFAALPKGMQEFVKTNGIDSLSYTPEIAPGKKKDLLSVEQARQQEAIFVEQLQKRLTPLMQSKPFLSANVSARKDILSRQVDAARRVATAIERGKVLRERGQGARPQ